MQYETVECELCGKKMGSNWYIRHVKSIHSEQMPLPPKEEKEVLGGLLLISIAAARTKAFAGLDYAGSGEHQDYPPGIIEVGVAKDAIDMIVVDVMKFVEANL